MKIAMLSCFATAAVGSVVNGDPGPDAVLWRRVPVPARFLITRDGFTFGGDLRIGDLNGDGLCDLLVYRCNHGAPQGAHVGGIKPCFLGAFTLDGKPLWHRGEGGNQPSRPMSVAVHDFDGDGAAEVVCFWHVPRRERETDWQTLADVVVQVRDGRTGDVLREAAPAAITERRRKDPVGANWVHQRILIANLRGLEQPRDFVVKLGDTVVAMSDELRVLWTYRAEWIQYGNCPAYIPAVGDVDGDGRDEVNGGYFLLDHTGQPLWEKKLGQHMDSVCIAPWDHGHVRAVCSGFGHVVDERGNVVLSLGKALVPHGQEVRVADFLREYSGPEMVLRWNGHAEDIMIVSSSTGRVVSRMRLNASPTNVGMEAVYWRGRNGPALLFNGGMLWDLELRRGSALPGLPPPNGGRAHRMAFYHCIPANLCGDEREELVLWDPTAAHVFIYAPRPVDESAYHGYKAGPRQYNPRLMD
ncbi:MAG TPA: hypothetical protein EYH34_19530 [Planctomycetes bacterium]|nr:hypothetical protein [Planctomycetota bacterium]